MEKRRVLDILTNQLHIWRPAFDAVHFKGRFIDVADGVAAVIANQQPAPKINNPNKPKKQNAKEIELNNQKEIELGDELMKKLQEK